ncbi:hypothetical protein [Paraclostridium bifermentans]|uniref:hypothetical protein n=1 Tax=Paraclostridium bifermentans TaxID=1490 RepID=UPI0018980799|nr:hypothetical protein [Paraclostridium bifermentans]
MSIGKIMLGVNLSNKKIEVRTSPGRGSIIGQLYPKECFTFTGKKSGDYYEIIFLSPNGKATGWYKGTNGVSYWKNRYVGSRQIGKRYGSYYGKVVLYNVVEATNLYTPRKEYICTLRPGDLVGFGDAPYAGHVGDTQKDWMRVNFVRTNQSLGPTKANDEVTLHEFTQYTGVDCDQAYVDTQWFHGSARPHVKGNW